MPKIEVDDQLVYAGGRPIGKFVDGVFIQKVTARHIFRELNAKGIDVEVHAMLKARGCWLWRLDFTDTLQVLSIPFEKIEIVGVKKQFNGAGVQFFVNLAEFTEKRPVIQARLL